MFFRPNDGLRCIVSMLAVASFDLDACSDPLPFGYVLVIGG